MLLTILLLLWCLVCLDDNVRNLCLFFFPGTCGILERVLAALDRLGAGGSTAGEQEDDEAACAALNRFAEVHQLQRALYCECDAAVHFGKVLSVLLFVPRGASNGGASN